MAFSNEGFTIDVIISLLRQTVFNPVIAGLLSLPWTLSYVERYLPDGIVPVRLPQIASPWTVLLPVWLGLSLWFWMTDFLNDGFANNWANDPTWDFNKEIVLITGGSSGIGARTAQMLLKKNLKTTIIIVDYSPLGWTPPPGATVHYYQGDLSNSATIRTLCERIRKEVGNPTVLVNNAGLVRGSTVLEGSYSDIEITIRTNLIAPFLMTKEFLPYMVKQNHGHIIHTGSMSSITPAATIADYSATKAGLYALHEALQLELKNLHNAPKVRLTLVFPFFVQTPLIKGHVGKPNFLAPLLRADTIAETFVDAMYSGRGRTVYLPSTMRLVHTLRVLPDWLFRLARESTLDFKIDFTGRQKLDEKTGGLS